MRLTKAEAEAGDFRVRVNPDLHNYYIIWIWIWRDWREKQKEKRHAFIN